jgi:hypothetical protein
MDKAWLDRTFVNFRRSARAMPPTKSHRPALWENMLGTVYAMNSSRKVRYFDYDYAAAMDWIGTQVHDVRVSKLRYAIGLHNGDSIRAGKRVWFVRDWAS